MLDEAEAERFLEAMRVARVAGDAEAAADLFDDEAVFRIVGFEADARGKAAVRAALEELIAVYEFLEWQPLKVFVAGDDIATQHRLKLRHRPTGTVVETQTSEFLSMKDGRCLSFTQYADTAKIAALSAP